MCVCVSAGVLWDGNVLMSVYACMCVCVSGRWVCESACVHSNNNFETQLELENFLHHKLNLKSNLNCNPNCNT